MESQVEEVWFSRQLAQPTDILPDRFPGRVAIQSEFGGFFSPWASVLPWPRVSSWARRGGECLRLLRPLVVFGGGDCAVWGLSSDAFFRVPRDPVFFCGLSFSFAIVSPGVACLILRLCGGPGMIT